MKSAVARFLVLSYFLSAVAFAQTTNQHVKRKTPKTASANSVRICQGVPIPDGYIIVSYESSPSCPHGAYVLKKDQAAPRVVPATQPERAPATASRPRKVDGAAVNSIALTPSEKPDASIASPPKLQGTYSATPLDVPLTAPATATSLDDEQEVSEGDVIRIDTNLVTVPVGVLDRQGRFISDLRRDQFKVFENGVEQQIAYFEPTEKPFTVALLLDTSASTFFHLWEIKEAAIAFAKQLRPQDRVLVVTFDKLVMLLTEATSDQNVVTDVIQRNAITGFSTRLYDAIDLVIQQRLNKIDGRKAIVVFTDGVDTASYQATYQSTLREVEELDALIYPVQYDTRDFLEAQTRTNATIVTTTTGGRWPYPRRSSSQVIYGTPSTINAITEENYKVADQFLHQLAEKSGGRLYQANDRTQLADAFSKIAEELRHQYSLGYYPQAALQTGERRQINVRVDRADVAVKARDSYVQRSDTKRKPGGPN